MTMLISDLPADVQTFRREIEQHVETMVLVANTADWALHEANVILGLCTQADEKWPDCSLAWGHFRAAAMMRRALEIERKSYGADDAREVTELKAKQAIRIRRARLNNRNTAE